MLNKAGVVLLPKKVGVPLYSRVIKRPCFERQVRKTRCYTNVVGCSVKILHLELFPSSSAVLVLFTQWLLYRQVLQMVVVFFPFGCKFHFFYSLRQLFLPCGPCGALVVRRCSPQWQACMSNNETQRNTILTHSYPFW